MVVNKYTLKNNLSGDTSFSINIPIGTNNGMLGQQELLMELLNSHYSMMQDHYDAYYEQHEDEYWAVDEWDMHINDLEYYKDKEGKKVFRLLVCSNCVSCENKKIVFRTRDANSSINIMKLTSCWIDKQERPLCFHISSFTSSSKNKEDEKVRPS